MGPNPRVLPGGIGTGQGRQSNGHQIKLKQNDLVLDIGTCVVYTIGSELNSSVV